jgi:DNA-binding NarL/FixJ family response regulator
MNEIRVLIIEDDPLIAADIKNCLNNIDFAVSAVVYNYTDAINELAMNTPDVVLTDINLGNEKDGIDIGDLINKEYQLPFIFLTSHADRATIDRAKKVKPAGYIVKPFDERDLLVNIEIALYNFAQRHISMQPKLSFNLINKRISKPLSDREFEVLQSIYEGKTNQQMAESLFVSVNTVKTHIANLYLKLEVSSRTAALVKIRTWF